MNTFENWGEAISTSFQNMWEDLINALPTFIGAVLVLIIGLLLASALGRLVARLVRATRIDTLVERTRAQQRFQEAGIRFSISGLLGWVAKWFLIIVTLIAFADILNWTQVTNFLEDVALYVPNVLVTVLILAIGLVAGRYIHELVERSITASRMPTSAGSLLGTVAEWAIVIFAVMAALTQLGIADRLIQILFTGLVAALALAFGLAFGLGGRGKARQWLEKLDQEMGGGKRIE